MKGVVFNVLEEVVLREYGPDIWDDLLDTTGVAGSYTSLGNYSDEEMVALVGTAAAMLNLTPAQVLRWFGQRAMPILAERYPVFFEKHSSSKSFVLSVNNIIHPEVRKLYSGANCPFFHFKDLDDGPIVMGYRSPRRMCALAQGFIEGSGGIFCEEVLVEHQECMHEGDDHCLIAIRWAA